MSLQRKTVAPIRMTLEEFLAWDDGTDHRYELRDGIVYPLYPAIENGQIVGMNPPAQPHQEISRNILMLWHGKPGRKPPCRAIGAQGIVIDAVKGSYYVPDVAYSCEERGGKGLEQPLAVAEVLSPGTMTVDFTVKLQRYQQVESIQEIWLVASRDRWATVFRKIEGQWIPSVPATGRGKVESGLLERLVDLDEIYAETELALPPDGELA